MATLLKAAGAAWKQFVDTHEIMHVANREKYSTHVRLLIDYADQIGKVALTAEAILRNTVLA